MKVAIIGGSGYAGGELIRLLLLHPEAEIEFMTSVRYAGEYLYNIHPNLRGHTTKKFSLFNPEVISDACELVFMATPHGFSKDVAHTFLDNDVKVIDLSADFRLRNERDYNKWYGWEHPNPSLLKEAVYGLPELYRREIREASLVACPGCMAGATILGLTPLVKSELVDPDHIVIDAKIGSSGGGSKPSPANHHTEKFGSVRPYIVVGHRHTAEIEQELSMLGKKDIRVGFTPHTVNMARGILVTAHLWPNEEITEKDLWIAYRKVYNDEPFIRFVNSRKGLHQLPDPKNVVGTNFCDIGFRFDTHANRLVVFSSIDNIVKGAAGQAVQCFNVMNELDEWTGLRLIGIH
jgi:N-acetyl-gamma-glutamyl-phosphate/LysW-gamma-L-alpha-aminoadipyl-6-phosphate reductase